MVVNLVLPQINGSLCGINGKTGGGIPGARKRDWGGRNKFWGAREVYLRGFERGAGAREIYPSLDQMNKVKTKNSEGFPAEIRNSNVFSGQKLVISKKKKVFIPKMS